MKKLLLSAAALLFATQLFAQNPRSEVSVSYGYAPTTDWIDTYSDALIGIFSGMDTQLTDWGAVSVGYNFRLSKRVSLGLQAVYSTNENEFFKDGVSLGKIDNRYWAVMPNLKTTWLNGGVVRLYSRLAAGIAFRTAKSDGERETENLFAYQVSPIGIELGGNLAAYAEAGIGMSGSLIVGARYRF